MTDKNQAVSPHDTMMLDSSSASSFSDTTSLICLALFRFSHVSYFIIIGWARQGLLDPFSDEEIDIQKRGRLLSIAKAQTHILYLSLLLLPECESQCLPQNY